MAQAFASCSAQLSPPSSRQTAALSLHLTRSFASAGVRPDQVMRSMRMAAPPLPEELVDEVLVRFPPDDPASLVRAALVSKQWCRLITGAHHGFSPRFCEFHRSLPLLGFLYNLFGAGGTHFVPTSSFRPPYANLGRRWRVVHSGHGRVLLHRASTGDDADDDRLVVWDPVTDEPRELPKTPLPGELWSWNAAVLCAAAAGGYQQEHRGPFLVVFVGTINRNRNTFSCVYSSKADEWSEPVFDRLPYHGFDPLSVGALVGNLVYFMYERSQGILKYDLLTQEMSVIPISATGTHQRRTVLMATEDGRLGLATAHESRFSLWSREQGRDAGWTQNRVIELDTLLPIPRFSAAEALVAGFADNGAGGVIFIGTIHGFFTIDLKSSRAKKVGDRLGFNNHPVVPYMSVGVSEPGVPDTGE